jgi:hypothetical protein
LDIPAPTSVTPLPSFLFFAGILSSLSQESVFSILIS